MTGNKKKEKKMNKAFPFSDPDQKIYFIAEIGSNHNQDSQRLRHLINAAKNTGFDAIKLQYYKAEKLWAPEFPERIAAAKKGELSLQMLSDAEYWSAYKKIGCGCSVFHKEDVKDVQQYVDFLKVASFECMRFDLIEECHKYNKPLFVSTGMCDRNEVYSLLRHFDQQQDAVFHCISEYPTSAEKARIDILKAIVQMLSYTAIKIGYSDHTKSRGAILAAINAGANIIEMHFDLDDGEGAETSLGHCWRSHEAKELITDAREMKNCDLSLNWMNDFSGREDRKNVGLRSDSDGMRPLKSERSKNNETDQQIHDGDKSDS